MAEGQIPYNKLSENLTTAQHGWFVSIAVATTHGSKPLYRAMILSVGPAGLQIPAIDLSSIPAVT
jgi:hypothetical protein